MDELLYKLAVFDESIDPSMLYDPSNDPAILLTEEIGATYYQLRQFVTLMTRYASDGQTKHILKQILKTLAIMEIKNKPVPTIAKLKANSPKLFKKLK